MLRRHLWLIGLMTIFGTVAGAGSWYLIRVYFPLYQAETVLQIVPAADADPMEAVTSEVQQDIQYAHRVAMAHHIKSQASMIDLLDSDEVKRTTWFRQYVGVAGIDANSVTPSQMAKAIAYLDKNLQVVPRRQTDEIVLTMTCRNPGDAALIVNEMARLFVRGDGQAQAQELRQRLTELNGRRSDVESDIRASERQLQRLRDTYGVDSLQQLGSTSRLDARGQEPSELERRIERLRDDIGRLQMLGEGSVASEAAEAVAGDSVLVLLNRQLTLLRAELAGRLADFGPDHREVRQIQEQIAEIEARLTERERQIADQTRRASLLDAREKLDDLERQLTSLQQMRDRAQERRTLLDEARATFEQAVTQREARVEALGRIDAEIETVRLSLDQPGRPTVEQLSLAPIPSEMVRSRGVLPWIPGGTVLGLLVGLFSVLLVETLNDQIRTAGDVTRFLGLPLLSVIPEAGEDAGLGDVDLCHVVREAPYSLLGESYRRCRTAIDLSASPGPKTLLIASGRPADGKTSVACNLAEAFAAKQEKVLLIDANLRQPRLHLVFPRTGSESVGDRRPGLTSILTGRCRIRDGIRPSGVAGLDLIYAGPPTANPADLLASRAMAELVKRVGNHYDRVIIDSPPVLLVSDVKAIAKVTDATVLVLRASATRRGVARRTLCEFTEVDARVMGGVLLGAEAMKGGYFRKEFKAYRDYLRPQLAASSA